MQYGAARIPSVQFGRLADRGQNFFAAAGGGTSTATQVIDVSKAEGQINQGNVRFNLGGWLGGTGSQADAATVTATFLSASGKSVGSATLDAVTAAMRHDATGLLAENTPGTLPKHTKSVRVMVTVSGSSGQGYADNLSFTTSSGAIGAPALPQLPAPETLAPPLSPGTRTSSSTAPLRSVTAASTASPPTPCPAGP